LQNLLERVTFTCVIILSTVPFCRYYHCWCVTECRYRGCRRSLVDAGTDWTDVDDVDDDVMRLVAAAARCYDLLSVLCRHTSADTFCYRLGDFPA